jgi:ubiquinone/menaquinone biosynthesis C-methylase UbiE
MKNIIAQQFGHPSGFAGRVATLAMNIINRRQYRAVEENIDVQPTDTILDIGFGNGRLLHRLTRRGSAKFYGIDPSPDMVHPMSGAQLMLADVSHIPLPDASVDKAYTVNTIYFWDDLHAGLAEVVRVLKPGGLFLDVFYSDKWLDRLPVTRRGFNKYSIRQVVQTTAGAGLEVERVIEIQRNKSHCVVARKK